MFFLVLLEAIRIRMITSLTQGSIDLALTYNMSPSPSIEFEPLIAERPYVLLAKSDPLADRAAISLVQAVYLLAGRALVLSIKS